MNILALTTFITSIIAILSGLAVLSNAPRNSENRLFFLLTIAGFLWILNNAIVMAIPQSWFFQSTVTPVSVLTILVLAFFIDNYLTTRTNISMGTKIILIISLPLLLLSFTPLNITTLNGEYKFGEIAPYYYLFVILSSTVIIRKILIYKKNISSSNQVRVRFFNAGIILTIISAVTLAVILPVIGYPETANYVFVSALFFYSFTTLSIIKNNFLDINHFIWRILSYIFTTLILYISLVFISIYGLSTVFNKSHMQLEEQIYIVFTALVAGVAFNPTRLLIDKLTNKIFLRHRYSVKGTIGEISRFVSQTNNAKKICDHTLFILGNTFSFESAAFIRPSGIIESQYGRGPFLLDEKIRQDLIKKISNIRFRRATITKDDVNTKMHNYLSAHNIDLVCRINSKKGIVAYLIIGPKASGGYYTKQDLQLLELVSNDLALALENAKRYEEIQQFNDTLKQKVSEATVALKRTNAKLVALDDAKDEFISMASHQMRTPLTSVKGYISMLLEEDLGKLNKAQKQALKEAFDSSQRMVFLISDFLNVSRIRTGRFMIEPSTMSMPEVVKQEISQLRDMAAYKEQKIQYVDPQDFPLVNLDENKVRQVMMNMIDNAMYYTPKGGVIDIILEKTDKEIIFKVVDSGIGVPVKEQHRLFTKFFRAANARRARPDGTGLGLFMAQKIITAQKGSIIFNSEENKGSTFGFRFPIKDIMIDNNAQKD